jgi:anti-sigma regulatory factor (Ser/Thr protein kinase)
MTAATRRECEVTPLPELAGAPVLGLLYLDVRGGRLHLLNDAARDLHAAGLPALGNEPSLAHLRTRGGAPVGPAELPLVVAGRKGHPAEAQYVLALPGHPVSHLDWTAAPLHDGEGKVIAVLASVCRTPPPPDWHALAGLAHDLRTPLQTLRFLSDPLGPQQPDDLRHLQSASERALQISADLLEWCRTPMLGGRRVEAAWFALEPFLSALLEEELGTAGRKGVALGSDLGAAKGWEACSDQTRLGRVLANLLSNAIRYTESGGRVTLAAKWRGEGDERALALEVRDTGAGISPEEQESIFQPFERGTAGKGDSSGGSGVGLSVVDRLVRELGLRREIDSEHGRGSDFRVLLPQRLLRPQ